MRPASGAPAFKPTARKSVKQPASKPVQTPKAEAIPKASKPAKGGKSRQVIEDLAYSQGHACLQDSAHDHHLEGEQGRYALQCSEPSQQLVLSLGFAGQLVYHAGLWHNRRRSTIEGPLGAVRAQCVWTLLPHAGGKPNARVREKGMPAARTPSTSNEFIAYTKSHLQIMIPVFIIVALLLIYTCVDIFSSFGRIHPGVSVQGIEVGGMSVQDAATKINEELSPKLSNAHVTIYESADIASVDGAQIPSGGIEQAHADETAAGSDINDDGTIDKWNITAETIGAYVDGEALAEEAYLVGRQGNFVAERFFSWFGGTHLDATVSVRDERFNALATEIDKEIGLPIVDSTIRIEDGAVSVVNGSDGWSVDAPTFIKRFSASAFSPDNFPFVIPMKTDPMHIRPATAQKVADDVKAAIAENVTIVHDPDTWTLDTADLGELISLQVLTPDEVLVFGSGTQKIVADGTTVSDYDTSAWVDPDSGYVLPGIRRSGEDRSLSGRHSWSSCHGRRH